MDTTTARYPEVASALREAPPGQAGRTVDLLARMQDLTDHDLHVRTGQAISRTSINQKRSGRSPVRAADLWPLADALGVEVDVLLLRPSEAARWLTEHRADELDGQPPEKHAWATSITDQDEPRTITHRRRDSPCRRPLVNGYAARLGCPLQLPHGGPPSSLSRR